MLRCALPTTSWFTVFMASSGARLSPTSQGREGTRRARGWRLMSFTLWREFTGKFWAPSNSVSGQFPGFLSSSLLPTFQVLSSCCLCMAGSAGAIVWGDKYDSWSKPTQNLPELRNIPNSAWVRILFLQKRKLRPRGAGGCVPWVASLIPSNTVQ